MRRAVAFLALALLAGCGGRDDGDANGTTAAVGEVAPRAEIVSESPMAWSYAGSAEAPEARFGVARDKPTLALVCDREGQLMRLRYAAPVIPDDARLVVAVPGIGERLLEVKRIGTGAVEAEVLLADPLFAAMGAPAARILVAIGSEPALPVPGGSAIRRTVDACRRPVEVRVEGATFAGLVPCADCPGIGVTLVFEGAEPGPGRYRLVKDYRDGSAPVEERGTVTVEQGYEGDILRLIPESGGAVTLLDRPQPGILLLRDARGQPDPLLDQYPLTRRR